MLRYLRRLADRDLALDRTMIPLGSCTMKLNATAEMEPITWPEFGRMHPFAPLEQAARLPRAHRRPRALARGDHRLRRGVAAAERRLAGRVRGAARDPRVPRVRAASPRGSVCLIPASAHGTNAASAAMAGMRVVVVACDDQGNVDLDDLKAKAVEHADRLGALMVTYPSTHGVFEEQISEICAHRARARRSGVPRRREPQRARRRRAARASSAPTCRTSTCTRRSASRTAVVVRASARSACARTSRRSCRTTRCAPRPARRPASARSAPRRGVRPASCRSRGCTCR